jgi:predicted dithiol-disulfide oxidoreductase (DUF899 family)
MVAIPSSIDSKHPPIVSRAEWLKARQQLLAKEKEHTRHGDALSAARRALPWVRVDKNYRFESERGVQTLAELFAGRSQLIVYHFMFDTEWQEGCKSCSFLADHFDGVNLHLPHHDVTLLAVARAPWQKLQAYKQRMGWHFPYVSSQGSDFNADYYVSPSNAEIADDTRYYNYAQKKGAGGEWPGVSVFYKNGDGEIFHTYSAYARGLDTLVGVHNFLDLTPKGRDETTIMDWVRHHDKYTGTQTKANCCATN